MKYNDSHFSSDVVQSEPSDIRMVFLLTNYKYFTTHNATSKIFIDH